MKAWIGTILCGSALLGVGGWWWIHTQVPAQPATEGRLVLVSDGLPQEGLWRQDFTFADMDGDGLLDLVTAPPRKGERPWPHIFLYRQGSWQRACPATPWGGFPLHEKYTYGGVAVADFAGNGMPEIAIAMHETGIRIFHSREKGPCGPWEERQDLPESMRTIPTRAIVAGDMDDDGRIDLVALSEATPMHGSDDPLGIIIFWNEASGWRVQPLPDSAGLFGDDIALGEVNGDGIPDIAVGSLDAARPEFVWLSNGEEHWKATTDGFPEMALGWSVQLVDMDNNGRDELILGQSGPPIRKDAGPRIFRWDNGRWHNMSQGLPQVSWVCGVEAVDLDGDGNKELIAADIVPGMVRVYGRQEDGTWEERQSISIPNAENLRNYKVRAMYNPSAEQRLLVANYAGEGGGGILAWTW